MGKEGPLKGFNDGQLRRFIKSYKKFPLPLSRMEDIAMDADLTEKDTSSLLELGRFLKDRCLEAVATDENNASKKVESVKFGKVSVNPKTLLDMENLLRPLGKLVPLDPEARKNWVVDLNFKDAHFDVSWSLEEDSKLLLGIYDHGLGSWEQVKSDKELGLGDKILLNASCKPQVKHLDTRAAYLLRMLAKQTTEKKKNKKAAKEKEKENKEKVEKEEDLANKEYKLKEEKKDKKAKAAQGPVHIGSCELVLASSLDPAIFAQCKEKMRNVKKSLKALDKPDPNQSAQEQVANTRRCLV